MVITTVIIMFCNVYRMEKMYKHTEHVERLKKNQNIPHSSTDDHRIPSELQSVKTVRI